MADKIRGITIEIGGDTTGLTKALKGVNSEIKSTQAQLKDVEKLLKLDPKNTELLAQKQKLLKKEIGEVKTKLDTLNAAEKKLKDNGVDKNSEQFMALRREIVNTEKNMDDLEKAAKDTNKQLKNNGATVEDAKKAWSGLGSVVKAGAKAMAAATATIGAAAAGVGAFAKQAVQSYSEYEQAAGGVKTLFGDAAGAVAENAQKAFATAGVSANQYLQTVTSFSASLISSLGGDTQAAAQYADRALVSMSDNANKMGTDMASIESAYQGFAKQNYTLLDNLKLGYGGTKTEMERLISDAAKMTDVQDKLNVSVQDGDLSFANIVNAIAVMQDHLGIAGATADEAGSTITGSLNATKAAWQNLVTGIADPNADLSVLIGNMVTAGVTSLEQLLPAIENALTGIATAITTLAPVIAERLPALLEELLPALITSAEALLKGLGEALPTILQIIIDLMPSLIELVCDTLLGMLDIVIDAGIDLILALADGLVQALPQLIPAVIDAVYTIVEKLTEPDTLLKLIDAAWEIIKALAQGLIKAFPRIVEAVGNITGNLRELFTKIDWSGIWDGIVNAAKKVWEGVKQVFGKVGEFFGNTFKSAWEKVTKVFSIAGSIFTDIKDGIVTAFKKIVNGLIGGINKVISKPFDAINTALQKIRDINILGAQPFKNLSTVSVPQIPMLASGGIVSSGSAIVGEAGPELLTVQNGRAVVQPLTTNNYSAPVSINVYGAAGQDVGELADQVADRIQTFIARKEAAF